MPRILYGVSPIGLGHATRSMVIVEALRRKGAEVRLFSGGYAAEFLKAQGLPTDDVVEPSPPRTTDVEMSRVALWYIRSWFAQRRNVSRVERLIDSYRPDLVVCDEEFSGVVVAGRRGIRRVFISDELTLGFARTWIARKIEGRVERWYVELQRSVDLLIVPEAGADDGNKHFVGPIVREKRTTCDEVRRRHGLPGGSFILSSLSGSGVGKELALTLTRVILGKGLEDVTLVVTGNRGARVEGERVVDLGLVQDNQDLVACADLVVTTAGKSTIDEAASAGTPVIAIPIRYHAEQERNAETLGYRFEDLRRLPELVSGKIGRREAPQVFRGEETASRLILALALR